MTILNILHWCLAREAHNNKAGYSHTDLPDRRPSASPLSIHLHRQAFQIQTLLNAYLHVIELQEFNPLRPVKPKSTHVVTYFLGYV